MEFVRVKYANNRLINSNLREHREIIEEYVLKKGCTYLGFVPVTFGSSGKALEADLIFKKPEDKKVAVKPETNKK